MGRADEDSKRARGAVSMVGSLLVKDGAMDTLAWLAVAVFAITIVVVISNVVVILMMAPVALPLARALKLPVTPLVLMIGLSANAMGSAMLLGDFLAEASPRCCWAARRKRCWHMRKWRRWCTASAPEQRPRGARRLLDH